MRKAMGETERRRAKQIAHNEAMGITPRSINKKVRELIDGVVNNQDEKTKVKTLVDADDGEVLSEKDLAKRIKQLEKQMLEHAKGLEFEKAARVRDQLALLREQAFGAGGQDSNGVPLGGCAWVTKVRPRRAMPWPRASAAGVRWHPGMEISRHGLSACRWHHRGP
ncbi:MAG: hypothetical protein CFE45_34400 [Burkholderiales bacterium PBB5]|nr:MAG: hypothetical protein CFE45_34400 [Burkholderiales bacterium PBB5]